MAGTPHADASRAAALARLDTGEGVAAVSAEMGIGLRTLRRWLAEARRERRRARAGCIAPAAVAPELPDDLAAVAVEAAIGGGWGSAALRALAVAGVSEGRAVQLRARVLARTAADLDRAPRERVAEFVIRLRYAEGLATDAGDLGTLARLLSLEARALGLDRLRVDVGVDSERFIIVAPSSAPMPPPAGPPRLAPGAAAV